MAIQKPWDKIANWINPDTYVWSRKAPVDGYSAVFFGFDDLFPQGGVNEMGLAFDVNALPPMRLNRHPVRPPAPERYYEYLLATNATGDEAVATLTGFSWGASFRGQIHLADAAGDAAVVSAGADGELVATRKRPGPGYPVSTNFNLAAPETGGYPGERYEQATAMLEQLMGGDRLEIDQVVEILDAVHQEGVDVNTMYANAVDLRRGLLYLYHRYQFKEAFTPEVSAAGVWLVLVALSMPIQLWLAALGGTYTNAYSLGLGTVENPLEEAMACVSRALRLDPLCQMACAHLAAIYFQHRNIEGVVRAGDRILELNPNEASISRRCRLLAGASGRI